MTSPYGAPGVGGGTPGPDARPTGQAPRTAAPAPGAWPPPPGPPRYPVPAPPAPRPPYPGPPPPAAHGGRRPWVRTEGFDWRRNAPPKVPPAIGAELERTSARRAVRRSTWYARRARAAAGFWGAVAGITAIGAGLDTHEWWMWIAAGVGSLAGGAFWLRESRMETRRNPPLPLPSAPAPTTRALSGSAAAEPLRRGEAAINAFLALARPLEPGPTSEIVRSAMASAAEVVDGLRARAERVVSCEEAARAVRDRAGQAQLSAAIVALVGDMNAAVAALDDLVAAAAEVVGAGVWKPAGYAGAGSSAPGGPGDGLHGPPIDMTALAEQAENLRGYASGLRQLGDLSRPAAPGVGPSAV